MKKNYHQSILSIFKENIDLKIQIMNSNIVDQILETAQLVSNILKNNGKLFFAGNGGSFADSQHLAAEFTSRFLFEREALPAISLGTNSSSLSAISNDYDFKNIFSRELLALGSKRDIFIPITTSGNSKNLIEAVKTAKSIGLKIIAFTGATGGALNELCDCIKVPSINTPRIQECHILIGHILCQVVEEEIFKSK